MTRRDFIRVAAATATPAIVPASALARDRRTAPRERIALGIVGLGSRGFSLIDAFLHEEDAQIVAVCDLDSLHYATDRGDRGPSSAGKGRRSGSKPGTGRIRLADGTAASASTRITANYAREKTWTPW